ncbi:MAG: dephospho-CoA kinase [Paracoccaceae bacterium]
MTFRLGLTGSIGMGKSTTAGFFAEQGVPVWDADATVHRLYGCGGAAALAVAEVFPDVMAADGSVIRKALREKVATDPTVLDRLTALVHPLVAHDRAVFLAEHEKAPVVLLDIPLLFENGLERECDGIVVVSASAEVQLARVMARGQMTEVEFNLIKARQMPDVEKRARATWVIETTTFDAARAGVIRVLSAINERLRDA